MRSGSVSESSNATWWRGLSPTLVQRGGVTPGRSHANREPIGGPRSSAKTTDAWIARVMASAAASRRRASGRAGAADIGRHRPGRSSLLSTRSPDSEHLFYHRPMLATYREEPCRTALNRVTGMGFRWSLNPYMGCAHRCAFCYVRGFERRADRPSDERYGSSVRVKVNVVDVLRTEIARRGWRRETVAIGAATDPY